MLYSIIYSVILVFILSSEEARAERSVCLSFYLSIGLSVCALYIFLSLSLSDFLSISLSLPLFFCLLSIYLALSLSLSLDYPSVFLYLISFFLILPFIQAMFIFLPS